MRGYTESQVMESDRIKEEAMALGARVELVGNANPIPYLQAENHRLAVELAQAREKLILMDQRLNAMQETIETFNQRSLDSLIAVADNVSAMYKG